MMRQGTQTEIPLPTRLVSNEEFPPLPPTAEQQRVETRILAEAARLQPVLARRLRPIRDLLSAFSGEEGGKRLIHAARCLDPRQTEGMTARLRQSRVPVRVIWGEQDEYLPVESVGRPLARALEVDLTLLPGGHFLPLDNPEGVTRILLDAWA